MTQFLFPKPTDWNAFEDIVCDVFARKYQNLNLQRYGRSGQRQHGVDIAGFTQNGLLGIQCKHHPKDDIRTAEIDAEVAKSDEFTPALAEFVIATSADRDTKSHNHVLQLAEQRRVGGSHFVAIKYWDDICGWLSEHPDLIYKHFSKFYPHRELEHLSLSALERVGTTSISWPFTSDHLVTHVNATFDGLARIDPYVLSIGLTMFDPAQFRGKTDVDIAIGGSASSDSDPLTAFSAASNTLKQLKAIITTPFFSRKLLVYQQARLSYAFLFGWTFRRVTGFDLMMVAGHEIWPSDGMILTPTLLSDDFPLIFDAQSDEIALVLNISRDVKPSVLELVESWQGKPKTIISYRLDGHRIHSAAHALSLSLDISRRIRNLIDGWGVRKIHLFGALPAALAVLIGHHLNAICPIHLYFLDDSRSSYQLGGTITNSL